jgi:hypothetical protein
VVAAAAGGEDDALDRQVVALRPTAGEDDLLRSGAEQVGDLPPRAVEAVVRARAVGVRARRVAPRLAQRRVGDLGHAPVDRRGRVVVEVDRPVRLERRVHRRLRIS